MCSGSNRSERWMRLCLPPKANPEWVQAYSEGLKRSDYPGVAISQKPSARRANPEAGSG
jgi:hypothetical protein